MHCLLTPLKQPNTPIAYHIAQPTAGPPLIERIPNPRVNADPKVVGEAPMYPLILDNNLPLILDPPHIASLIQLHIKIPNIILPYFSLQPLFQNSLQASQVRIGELSCLGPAEATGKVVSCSDWDDSEDYVVDVDGGVEQLLDDPEDAAVAPADYYADVQAVVQLLYGGQAFVLGLGVEQVIKVHMDVRAFIDAEADLFGLDCQVVEAHASSAYRIDK